MHAQDFDVLRRARDWCCGDARSWLCTIVNATGSSPRPVGSMLALTERGTQVGSVSGGCVEEDLIERLMSGEFDVRKPQLIDYGINAEDNERLGLPCGGSLQLLLQRLDPNDSNWLDSVLQALSRCGVVVNGY